MCGQCEESLEKSPGFGLGTWHHARDGALPQQGAHRVGVDAEPEDPRLGALVIGGRCGIQRHRKPLPRLEGRDPGVLLAPNRVPREALRVGPFDRQWSMSLVVVPGAQPYDVLGCCGHSA